MQTIKIDLPEDIKSDIAGIKQTLNDLKKNFQPTEQKVYLTRDEVSKMFGVDIGTVHNWRKKGIIKAHQIGGRVFYIKKEIEDSLVPLKR